MKQLKRERYRNMVKRINDLPDDKQMFVIGIINGMLLTAVSYTHLTLPTT